MRPAPFTLVLLFLAACAKGPQADLPAISKARSLGAEWALVNEQASQSKLTAAYVAAMHKSLRAQLQSAVSSLSDPNSNYGQEIRTLLSEPDNAAPEELRAHAGKLRQIEGSLESA